MQDLYAELDELTARLERELETCLSSGCQLAENERDYRVAKRRATLEERARGTAVTLTDTLVNGLPEIADARMRRDCSEAIYKTSCEAVNVIKLRMRMVDAQITRVWTSGGTQR